MIGTRNCRLAAIRSFFNFVATRDPASIAQCVETLNIPVKRAPVLEPCYLEPAEVAAILAQPARSTVEGMRDHALLSFLYNSGARIQEALDLCPEMIRFDSPSCVRLTGKGRKERICPLWPETASSGPTTVREPLWRAAQRLGLPVQTCGLCESGDQNRAIAAHQACDATQLPPRNRRTPRLDGHRSYGHPQLVWPREPRHHQPLREGQSRNEAKGAGKGQYSSNDSSSVIMEAGRKPVRLARCALK